MLISDMYENAPPRINISIQLLTQLDQPPIVVVLKIGGGTSPPLIKICVTALDKNGVMLEIGIKVGNLDALQRKKNKKLKNLSK